MILHPISTVHMQLLKSVKGKVDKMIATAKGCLLPPSAPGCVDIPCKVHT